MENPIIPHYFTLKIFIPTPRTLEIHGYTQEIPSENPYITFSFRP